MLTSSKNSFSFVCKLFVCSGSEAIFLFMFFGLPSLLFFSIPLSKGTDLLVNSKKAVMMGNSKDPDNFRCKTI